MRLLLLSALALLAGPPVAHAGTTTFRLAPPHCDPAVATACPEGPQIRGHRDPRPIGVGVRKIRYGGAKTITCLQGGAIVLQHVGATFVRADMSRDWMDLRFKIDGQRRRLTVPVAGMSCLVEDFGDESMPIVATRR
jgi:hypothetical protein